MLIYRPEMGVAGNPKAPTINNNNTGIVPMAVSAQTNIYLNFPEILAKLLSALPPPNVYQAPTLDVDQLITLIQETPIPNAPTTTTRTTEKTKSSKRKTADSDSEDEEEEKGVKNKPPTNDAYRNRQAAKLARTHKV